jgi:hypothetical protein
MRAVLDGFEGSDIEKVVYKAIRIATCHDVLVQFEFNGVFLEVEPGATMDEVMKEWRRGIDRIIKQKSLAKGKL